MIQNYNIQICKSKVFVVSQFETVSLPIIYYYHFFISKYFPEFRNHLLDPFSLKVKKFHETFSIKYYHLLEIFLVKP